MSNQTDFIVEDDASLAALNLPIKDPADARVDQQGVLYVKTAIAGVGPSGQAAAMPDSGAADGQVLVKVGAGNLLKSQFIWSEPFEGQLYYQLYNSGIILGLPTILLPFASIPFTMNKVPIIDYAAQGGIPFNLGLLVAISTAPNTIVAPSLSGSVASQFV
jgi:hypothetical protein